MSFFFSKGINEDYNLELILYEMEKIMCGDKKWFINQTYDGALVMKGRVRGVNVKVKKFYENVYYVHCAVHQLNLLLLMTSNCIWKEKLLFAKFDRLHKNIYFYFKSHINESFLEKLKENTIEGNFKNFKLNEKFVT